MIKLKVCNLSFQNVVFRFYLMMAGAIALGFAGQITLAALFAGTLALLTILGVSIQFGKPTAIKKQAGKVITLRKKEPVILQKMG